MAWLADWVMMILWRFEPPGSKVVVSLWDSYLPTSAITEIDSELLQPLITAYLCLPQKLHVSDEWQVVFKECRLFIKNPMHSGFFINACGATRA